MTYPTLRCEVAFGTDPLEDPDWTDITDSLRSFATKTGRQFELDAFQPGTLNAVLDNTDRRFDPLNADGPHYGNLLPRKRVRLQADWGAYLVLTGASGSRATTPDAAALDITGDIDIRAKIALTDWTPAAAGVIASKATFTGNQVAYGLGINTDGTLTLFWSPTGTGASTVSVSSTVAPTAAAGDTLWVRVTLDVNDGSGNRVIRFYTSTDPTHDHSQVTWTQLGATITTAGTTSIFASTSPLALGAHPENINRLTGNLYAAAVLNGIGGTVVANADFTDGNRFTAGATTGTDKAGRAWTVVAPASLVAETYDLWHGFVDTWPQESGRFTGTVPLKATDLFRILASAKLAGGGLAAQIAAAAPTHWWQLGEPAGSAVAADTGSSALPGQYRGAAQDQLGADGLDPGSDATCIEFTGVDTNGYVDVTGPNEWTSLACLFRSDPVGADNGWLTGNIDGKSVLVRGTGSFPGQLEVDTLTGGRRTSSRVDDGLPHLLVVVETGTNTYDIYVDGQPLATVASGGSSGTWVVSTIGSSPTANFQFDGRLQHLALFDYALTADQIAALGDAAGDAWDADSTGARIDRILDLAGWPADQRDIDTGLSLMGPVELDKTSALAAIQTAEATEAGAFWIAPDGRPTFRDRHAPLLVEDTSRADLTDDPTVGEPNHYTELVLDYDDTLIVNDVDVVWAAGTENSTDADSIAAYTRQSQSVATGLRTAAEARARGDWMLNRYAQPHVRPASVTLRPTGDERLWRAVLGLRIGQRVTVRRQPHNTGDPFSIEAIIEAIDQGAGDGVNTWETTLTLSPAAISQDYWIDGVAGAAEAGTTTVPAF